MISEESVHLTLPQSTSNLPPSQTTSPFGSTLSQRRFKQTLFSVESEDDDQAQKTKSMTNEKRKMQKYLVNNFYPTILENRRQVLKQEKEEEETRRKSREKSAEGSANSQTVKDETDEVPQVKAPKEFIHVDESLYEQKCAKELKEKVLEQQEAQKVYPQLNYASIPELSPDDMEMRLMASLLLSLKNGEERQKEIVMDDVSSLNSFFLFLEVNERLFLYCPFSG